MSAAPAWRHDDQWDLFSLGDLADGGVDAYLQRVAERASDLFRASGASIFIVEDVPGRFQVRACAGKQSTVPSSACIVLGMGLAGKVVESGVARIIGDASTEPLLMGVRSDKSSISSSMIVPLADAVGQIIGVLNLSRHEGVASFQESDLEHAKAVGTMIALAVSNARLMDCLSRQIVEVQLTSDRLQAVFDSVGSALLLLDEKGMVIESNEPAQSLLSRGEGSPLSLESFAPALRQAITKIRTTGKAESIRVTDSGAGSSWLISGTPIPSGGTVIAIIDLTGHETAVKEGERLRRLAEIGQMTAAIAHEIRNPLTGIRSAAQMVREDPESAEDFLGVIEEEVLKLNSLCEEFLAFSKPMELLIEESDLGALVRNVCERQKPEYALANVALAIESNWEIPTINLDRRRIEQVIHNLLRNAREACKSGGTVRVEIADSKVVVRDSGTGMSNTQLEKLFSPFFTTKPDGTGLGLCNVRRILDAHGAKITAESVPGQGSVFTVEFDRSRF